mgnify:FL=1
MSNAVKISGKSPVQISNGTRTTTVAQIHSPASNLVAQSNKMMTSEYGQRVRSVSTGRSPEGMKMSTYTGNIIHGEKHVVPLQDRK